MSTVDDYLAFGRMMLSNGKAGSERILSRLSVRANDHEPHHAGAKSGVRVLPRVLGQSRLACGLSIVTTRDDVGGGPRPLRLGWRLRHVLVFGPKEDMTAILMTQRVWDAPTRPPSIWACWTSTYRAIDD